MPGPLTLAEQGAFFVNGRVAELPQTSRLPLRLADGFDLAGGGQFVVDQMYVQYQVAAEVKEPPLVLVYGGGHTGHCWDTTPDGREGSTEVCDRILIMSEGRISLTLDPTEVEARTNEIESAYLGGGGLTAITADDQGPAASSQ